MAGTVVADTLQAASTSTLVLKNGVANTPPTVQDSAGTEIGTFCRAWVNFNGTGTVAIRSSFNVSSITDNDVGNYNVNFTTAMPDINYAAIGTCDYRTTVQTDQSARSTSSVNVTTAIGASGSTVVAHTDKSIVAVAIFR